MSSSPSSQVRKNYKIHHWKHYPSVYCSHGSKSNQDGADSQVSQREGRLQPVQLLCHLWIQAAKRGIALSRMQAEGTNKALAPAKDGGLEKDLAIFFLPTLATCIKDKSEEIFPRQDLRAKKKDLLNRVILRKRYQFVVHWKCEGCHHAVFSSFQKLREHKIQVHAH
jgi:hypothetical protein